MPPTTFCFDCFTVGVRNCKLHSWKRGVDPNTILPNVNKSVIQFGKNSSFQNETRKVDDTQMAKDLKKARLSLQKLEIEVSVLKDETKKKDSEMEKLKNENKNLKIELSSRQQNLFYKKMFMCPLCEIRGWTEEEVSHHLKNFHKVSHDAQKKKNLKIECV